MTDSSPGRSLLRASIDFLRAAPAHTLRSRPPHEADAVDAEPRSSSAGVGAVAVERWLVLIISAFGVVYSLQNLDGLIADWPAMSGPVGGAVVALVAASCCTGIVGIVKPAISRHLFTVAVVAFVIAAALWPLSLHATLPADPFPWLTSTWPIEAVYLCGATRRIWIPLVATAATAVALAMTLTGPGGFSGSDLVSTIVPMCAISAVLVLLIGALRHRIRLAERAQHNSLVEYQQAQREVTTEAERVRTDALVHDSVLTTLLSAAAAGSEDDEELAARMASNALRVLNHVNRRGAQEQVLPFTLLLEHAQHVVPDAFAAFTVTTDRAVDIVLPTAAADALLAAMVETMDNSIRHAGDADRVLSAEPLGPDGIRVLVSDDGAGFDVEPALAMNRGLQLAVVERMRQVFGRADVVSALREGTSVTISWGSVVVSGTRPLEDRKVVTS
jgi:two-component sensor histidine kinase